MQWTPDRNAGFSTCDPGRLNLPIVMDPVYGYQAVNVEAQSNSSACLLHWTRRMIEISKQHPAFGLGDFHELGARTPRCWPTCVSSSTSEGTRDVVLCVNNMSRFPQPVELDLIAWKDWVPTELTRRRPLPRDR